jgi:hypothetical protein
VFEGAAAAADRVGQVVGVCRLGCMAALVECVVRASDRLIAEGTCVVPETLGGGLTTQGRFNLPKVT